jgi:glycosyltransferase involved in cell wall biosynthesis
VPFICRRLVQNGYKFKWFLIGFGGDEDLIRRNIQKVGMQDVCIILGKKANPYPYMAACDIYVQPSRFEGKAVTVQEAQILGKPVVVADYPTARSQVKDGIDGHIVPQDNEGLAKGLAKIIREVSEKS